MFDPVAPLAAGATNMRETSMKRIALLFAALLAYMGLAFAAVNVNSATKEQLESLNGIGPVKAQAIIDYRAKNGPFKKLEDLKNVDGIGDATFDKIRPDVSLSGTTTVPKADAAKPAEKKAAPAEKSAAPAPAPAPAEKKSTAKKDDAKKDEVKKDDPKAAKQAKADADKAKKEEEKAKKEEAKAKKEADAKAKKDAEKAKKEEAKAKKEADAKAKKDAEKAKKDDAKKEEEKKK
jgi:competence protein ComEA